MKTRALVLAIGLGAFLLAQPAYAAVDAAALCKDKKLKATGLKTKDLLKAFGKNIKVPDASKLGLAISKAQSKFTKKFTKAEFDGQGQPKGCLVVGDANDIELATDEFVAGLLDSFVFSSATQVANQSECVGGPLARCRVGDYLLENSEIRVVIQDVQRNLFGIGQFGGNIIDADLVRGPGEDEIDNFEEWSTSLNIENTAHYTDITIINDGSDGNPAIIRATGVDDLLDFLNPSSVVAGFGFSFPSEADDTDLPVEISTDFILAPGTNWVRVETTIQNTSGSEIDLFVGDFLNGSGQVELFQPGYGFGETLVNTACPGAASNPCNAVIYRGIDGAAGVSYGWVHEVPGTTQFTTSGVTVPQLGANIALVLLGVLGPSGAFPDPLQPLGSAGDSVTVTRYFVVGDGTVSSILKTRNRIQGLSTGTLEGTVETVTGGPAAGVEIAVLGDVAQGPQPLFGPAIELNVVNHTVSDALGHYELTLAPGDYDVVANLEGHPYEGGGDAPLEHPVTITASGTTTLDVTLPDSGTLQVNVADGLDNPLPAKASVVGLDPSKPVRNAQSLLAGAITNSTAVFRDRDEDGLPFGVAQVLFIDPSGASDTIPLEPGSYEVVVSRGPKYSIDSIPVTVTANALSTVDAAIAPVIDTSGFVSGDFHVHSIDSADSEVTPLERVVSMLAEGTEFFTPSDHDFRSDFQPLIVSNGWQTLVTTATSNEMTTFDYGHFNSWPMTIDPNQVNGGSVDHSAAAPAGQDFPSFGNYSLTPEEIVTAARLDPGSETVQINHIASHFGLSDSGLAIDTGLEPPKSAVPPAARRLDPALEDVDKGYFTATVDALEIWIGDDRSHIFNNFLGQNAGDWFNMLNQGIVRTGVADSDTHRRIKTQSGVPRTMVASSEEDLTLLDPETLSATVNSGRAFGTNGPMIRVEVEALTSAATASLEEGNATLVSAADGKVEIAVEIQSPVWAEFDTVEYYLNSTTLQSITSGVQSGAGPVDVARYAIAPDYIDTPSVSTVLVDGTVPGGYRLEATSQLTLDGTVNPALTEDTWIVVMVKGTDGVSKPLFPVIPNDLDDGLNSTLGDLTDGNLGEDGIPALAFTNPLFVDVNDGGAGAPDGDYDPPGVQCIATAPHPKCVTTTSTTTTTTTTTTSTTTTTL